MEFKDKMRSCERVLEVIEYFETFLDRYSMIGLNEPDAKVAKIQGKKDLSSLNRMEFIAFVESCVSHCDILQYTYYKLNSGIRIHLHFLIGDIIKYCRQPFISACYLGEDDDRIRYGLSHLIKNLLRPYLSHLRIYFHEVEAEMRKENREKSINKNKK